MNIGSLSVVRALAKSIDFLVSFIVGYASDNWRTRWGRRLPYIVLGSLVAPIAMLALADPPRSSEAGEAEMAAAATAAAKAAAGLGGYMPFAEVCTAEQDAVALQRYNGTCSNMDACLQRAIAQEQLPNWDYAPQNHTALDHLADPSYQRELVLWFFTFFVMRHSLGHTVVQIPYDALGQELTTRADDRQRLFATKSVFNFVGLTASYVTQVVAALAMATDLVSQAMVAAAIAGGMMLISMSWLTCMIHEKPSQDADDGGGGDDGGGDSGGGGSGGGGSNSSSINSSTSSSSSSVDGRVGGNSNTANTGNASRRKKRSTPFLATMHALSKNQPYRNYLALRLWATFAFHLPFFARLNYLKYVMGFENAQLASTASAFAAQLTSFISVSLTIRVIRRVGKIKALVGLCALASAIAAIFAIIPPQRFKELRLYMLQPVVEGVTQVALYMIPESMLADIID
jgi:Na+/melibiose symporter-like transporter